MCFGPSVSIKKSQVAVRRGDRVTLVCEADGDRPLNISWKYRGMRIDPKYDIKYHIKQSEIRVNEYGRDQGNIYVQIQEPPNFPQNLRVLELGSRVLTLGWQPNEMNNAIQNHEFRDAQPITNYILQYKESQDVWHEHNTKKLLKGDKTTTQVEGLKPSHNYHFRLYAENHLGISAPSDILHVQTDSEIPSMPPKSIVAEAITSQQILLTWIPPDRDSWNGELLGYTIGFSRFGSSQKPSYNFTKISVTAASGSNGASEHVNKFRLTDLEKYTQYSIKISAYNVKGDGPYSEPIIAYTLEDVPSTPPQNVMCEALTAQNIQVSWQLPPKDNLNSWDDSNGGSNRETKITSSLNTVLHGLQPFTNYSIQVLAFTKAGDGVLSAAVNCITKEAVPDAPERVKTVVNSESSAIISWLPPKHPNGVVTKYHVYIRILDKGQELKILKETLPAYNTHFEVKDLTPRETYEAWVTASTQTGQGPSTPVIKLTPSNTVPAAIISFGQTLSVSWKVDVKLSCFFVGIPKPSAEWKVINTRAKKHSRLEVSSDNVLILRSVQRSHEGNYSCVVRNNLGTDQIIYNLLVQVPPSPPELFLTSHTPNSVSLDWNVKDNGGAPLRKFLISYRKEFSDWEEIELDHRMHSYVIDKLQCGTQYQFTISAINKIGTSETSPIEFIRTKGRKPIAPQKHFFIRPNVTSVLLELTSWQDGGCPILFYTIEFRKYGAKDWIVVSSSVVQQ
uniref:Down syndrome cell adhesion molecule-like protein Dscam2 n=1 Tax=Megaselia scalaris TaxID=36166 RepID=T1GSG6_MEGSC